MQDFPRGIHEEALRRMGWKESNYLSGTWLRPRGKWDGARNDIVSGPYLPEYKRLCKRIQKEFSTTRQ